MARAVIGDEVGIMGAGVGGLALATALARAGLRPHVFERASQTRKSGGALILWCNALRALARLGLDLQMLAAPTAQPVELSEFRRPDGSFITSMPVGAVSRRFGGASIVIARRDLIEILYDCARQVSELRFGVAVRGLVQDGEGVAVQLSDGTERRFAYVVGADGLRSTVRELLGLSTPLRSTAQDLWVGTTRSHPQLEPGRTVATVGAGLRFWHALLGDGRAFWYATVSQSAAVAPAASVAELARSFRGWHDPIPQLLADTDENDVLHTRMRDREPSRPWGRGRVTLLGDAAHPMTPDLGQGACQAIESAVALADAISAGDDALRRYEERRFARTSDINRMSWLVANTSSVATPLLCTIRDTAMRVGLRATFEAQLGWLLGGGC